MLAVEVVACEPVSENRPVPRREMQAEVPAARGNEASLAAFAGA